MDDLKRLDAIASELIQAFDIQAPPIPIEHMLRHPRHGMWAEVDVTRLSGTFMITRDIYSPRMSLARMLARHVASSKWGKERGLPDLLRQDEQYMVNFGRMLIMPAEMVLSLSSGARQPVAMSMTFEVPEDDARIRLQDLADRL